MSVWDLAADDKGKELADLLKKSPNDKNKVDRGYKNWTPLHHAARYDCCKSAKVLIDAGVNLDAKDQDKETPLHICARNRSKLVCVMLVKAGANVNARNKRFQDVKTVASENSNVDIKDFLEDTSKPMKNVDNIYNSSDKDGSKSGWSFGY